MTDDPRYASPQAFRRALTDRLTAAAESGSQSLPELQRQFAYDRLLARLYADGNTWILKGATALIARGIAVRSTIDVDIYRERPPDEAEAEVRKACERNLGDWFNFQLGPGQPVNDGSGVRLRVDANVGPSIWAQFHIDLVGSDLRMTGQPDEVPSIAIVRMPQIKQDGYLAYPLVDHVADKVCAVFQRYGLADAPSTRYKDLVDLVAIIITSIIDADSQTDALRSEASRRGLVLPDQFGVPDLALWEKGYAAEAGRSTLPVARTLTDALVLVRWFVDPILEGSARGRWEPSTHTWIMHSERVRG